jgi:hypothetical protein
MDKWKVVFSKEFLNDLARKNKFFDWLETKYYKFTIGIGNIFRWLPVVWKDRDWEYEEFTERFIHRKLKNLQKRPYHEIFEEGWWMEKYINLCIWLMDEKKKMENLEDDLWKSIDHGETFFGEPDEEGAVEFKTKWSSPEAKAKYWEVEKIRYKRQEKIHHLIYKILETRGQGWWD